MAKTARNDVGSVVVLERPPGGPTTTTTTTTAAAARAHSKLWHSFSSASFRRIILDAVRCSSGGCGGKHSLKSTIEDPPQDHQHHHPQPKPESKSLRWELRRRGERNRKLSELLRLLEPPSEEEEVVKRKTKALEELKAVVKRLQKQQQPPENDAVLEAAREVRRLTREDPDARATLALLGAIPPLVALLDSADVPSQIASLYALLNLAIANDANKAAIVKAGGIHKMLKLIQPENGEVDRAVSEAIVANFLGLSALDSNKAIIGSSGAILILVKALKEEGEQAKQDALRALYNISILPLNVSRLVETGVIAFLMSKLGDMDVSERILSILSNVASVPEGRKAISDVREAFTILIDILNWTDSPGCQEKASYILMVMAHKAYGDRQAMLDAGIVSTLLELTLLGSTLAQKRASRILECLRVDKGKQVAGGGLTQNLSAPLYGGVSGEPNRRLNTSSQDEIVDDTTTMMTMTMSEEAKAVKQLVQQSLQSNMKRIAKRANLPQDFVPSDHFKALTSTSTSKSLPF